MATTEQYLTQLQTDKQTLVANLNTKGVSATNDETFTSLAPKVLDIPSGTTPTGTIEIKQNGTYDVSNYASADVDIPSGSGGVDVGRDAWLYNYPDDDKTRIFVTLTQGTLNPRVIFKVDGTTQYVTIDWGDGTTDQITPTSTQAVSATHTYSSKGNYIITIDTPKLILFGSNTGEMLFNTVNTTNANERISYMSCVRQLSLKGNISAENYSLLNFTNLFRITFPNSMTNIPSYLNKAYSFYELDFSEYTSVPTLGSSTAINTTYGVVIVVPDALYNDWISATNWSALADYIVKVSDYNG